MIMNEIPFWKKLLFPPLWLILLLTAVSAAALTAVFLKGWMESPIAYGIYVLSFYTLCVLSLFFIKVLPGRWKGLNAKAHTNPIIHRYLTDAAFKTHISLYASLGVNLLYVGLNILSWFLYRSMWFVVLAGYYTILAVMRFLLLRYVRVTAIGQNRLGELNRSRLCSCILLLLNFVLSGAVLMILYQNKGYNYHGILIYVMALYTFYITTHAIIGLVRYRKYKSPVMTTARIIALSAALVSMLNLETAMFAQFGADMTPENQRIFIVLTGAGVSIAVITLSVLLIVKATKEIKGENHGK